MTTTQPLIGYRTNKEWQDLVAQVATMIENLEKLEDPQLRRQVFGTLQAIDAVHREALHRLVRLFKEGVLEQVVTDPAIHTLMGMYDLLPTPQTRASQYDFLTAEERAAGPRTKEGRSPSQRIEGIDSANASAAYPHWTPILSPMRLADGDAVIASVEEGAVIVARVDGVYYCVDASCPEHGSVMHGGVLRHVSWICPFGPGCIYDVRNGARLGGGNPIAIHPVRLTEVGGLQIGFGIPHEPNLPAF